MNRRSRLARSIPVLVLASILAEGASAQRRKLNGPLAEAYLTEVNHFDLASGRIVYQAWPALYTVPMNGTVPAAEILEHAGSVTSLQLSPDGSRLVLAGTLEQPHASELFSLPADGSGPRVRLHPSLTGGADVSSFRIAPDGSRIVFQVRPQQEGGEWELFSAPLDGSEPAVGLGSTYGTAGEHVITSDSRHVLFSDHRLLFTVPIEGGVAPVRVHGALGGNRWVRDWVVAPDGSRVVYVLNYDDWNVFELYSAPVDASAPQMKLNGPLVAGGDVARVQMSPFSTHVTYVADQEVDGVESLYGVPIGGGPVLRFAEGIAGREILDARISPDRTHMVFVAGSQGSFGRFDLFGVPVDGSAPPVNLTASLADGTLDVHRPFQTDPLSGRLLFRFYQNASQSEVVYSVANDGSAPPVRLSPAGSAVSLDPAHVSLAGGSRAVFVVVSSASLAGLYGAPLDGSSPAVRLHPPLVAGGSVLSFALDAAGARVVYRAEQDIEDLVELFVVPVDGSAPPTLRSTIRDYPSTVGDVSAFKLTADGTRAVYRANQASGNGLYVVALDGVAVPWFLAPGASTYLLTPDSQRAVYAGYGIESVPLDGSAAPTVLSTPGFLESYSMTISPDSTRVVHRHQTDNYSPFNRLFSTRVTGGVAVELNLPRAAAAGDVQSFEITPDSTRVVYAGAQDAAGVVELFSAPLAGGAPRVKLSDALVAGGDVGGNWYYTFQAPAISPDSTRVVYLADRDIDESFELYSVVVAGGAPPVELSALAAPDRDVIGYAITPDSARVVYVADQDADDVYELFSVPLAGGAPLELSALSGPDTDVDGTPRWTANAFLISPDSRWVVYRADQDADEAFELYRAPCAGGAPPLRLTLGTSDNELVAIDPNGEQVLHTAAVPGGIGLFRVPLAGGAAVRLSGDHLVASPAIGKPLATLDSRGRTVLFNSYSPNVSGVHELFAVPLHGLRTPAPVNGPLTSASPTTLVGSFRPGASSVVYLAEQDEPGVAELYVNELRLGHLLRR